MRFVSIAILGPLLGAAGCGNENEAQRAFERGVAHADLGETDKAIADYTEAIRLKPDDAKAYYNRGVAFEDSGDKSKAEQDFAKAKKLGYEPE